MRRINSTPQPPTRRTAQEILGRVRPAPLQRIIGEAPIVDFHIKLAHHQQAAVDLHLAAAVRGRHSG